MEREVFAIPQGGVQIQIKEEKAGSAVIYSVEAYKEPSKPLFGQQNFFRHRESVAIGLRALEADSCLAIYQHKDWWVRPAFADSLGNVPERTQLLLTRKGADYTVVLAVCGEQCRSDIRGRDDGLIITVSINAVGYNAIKDISFVVATGTDPYRVCEDAVKAALTATGRETMYRTRRVYPELFEYFGWCSWDAFYHKVNAAGIREKLEELTQKQIPVKWVLIDDGWLDADYEKQVLRGLDADREKFPEGLGSFTADIKERYQLDAVGVWHAVMGYWNGLEAGSPAADELASGSRQLPDGRIIPEAEESAAFSFYSKWHSYLRNRCGIDFVKVDGQSAVSIFYEGRESYGAASRAVQSGLGASAALHFNNRIINCMGMAGEDMWNRPSSAISRSSDDFVPEVPHGFREHAIQNSYNSLLQGQFFYGDWDMFWSSHVENRQNSMLRAVSGGPVYTSDAVGETDAAYIMPLILEDGRVNRCEGIGVPTVDCLFMNPVDTTAPLKIFNHYGESYVIAAMNINGENKACQGELHLGDIPALEGSDWYVYDYRQESVSLLTGQSAVPFSLEANDANLFVLVKKEAAITPLGLVDKYVSTAGIEERIPCKRGELILLKQGGCFGFVSEKPVEEVLCNGEIIEPEMRENGLCLLQVPGMEKPMVEIRYQRGQKTF